MTHESGFLLQKISFYIITAGSAQGLFLSLLFSARALGRERGGRRPEFILSLLMLAFTVNIIHAAFIRPALFGQGVFHSALEPFQLLFGPLVYEYVRALVQPEKNRLDARNAALQTAVFISITAFFVLSGFIFRPDAAAVKILDGGAWITTLAYLFHYLGRTLRMVNFHRRKVTDEFTSTRDVDLSWVRVFILMFLFLECIWLAMLVWLIHFDLSTHFTYANALASALVVYALGFRGLLQKPAVRLPEENRNEETPPAALKYGRSGLAGADLEKHASSLLKIMETKKPWVDSGLNLQDLADFCGMSRHNLTEVINRSFEKNFCDFVNEYRVAEFKRLLARPDSANFTILALAFDAGFNSKATFNAAFRKASGITPSEYRKSVNLV
jgi:AraC-like DNA-binding protein